MRAYLRNSPQAAGRLVALTLMADDHACASEFAVLHALGAEAALGLAPGAMVGLTQELCEDLMLGAWQGGSMLESIDERSLAQLMAEVDDPALRAQVLRLTHAVVEADGHLADGEALLLAATRRFWGAQTSAPA
jgi:hypothetical protein